MQEISLYDLIKFYVKKWRLIASLTLAGLLAGLVYNTFIQVPEYKSSTKLLLVSSQTTQTTTNQTLINNYIDLITSRRVLEPVVEKHNKSMSYEQLLAEVKAVNQKDTAIMNVTVTTNGAKQSADIANEITDSFKTAVNSLYQSSGVIVVDPAVQPTGADNVHSELQILIAIGIGFVSSLIGLFFVYDYTGGKIKKSVAKKKIIKKPVKKRRQVSKAKALTAQVFAYFAPKPTQKVAKSTATKIGTKSKTAATKESITTKKTTAKKATSTK